MSEGKVSGPLREALKFYQLAGADAELRSTWHVKSICHFINLHFAPETWWRRLRHPIEHSQPQVVLRCQEGIRSFKQSPRLKRDTPELPRICTFISIYFLASILPTTRICIANSFQLAKMSHSHHLPDCFRFHSHWPNVCLFFGGVHCPFGGIFNFCNAFCDLWMAAKCTRAA